MGLNGSTAREVSNLIRARYSLISITSHEERRVEVAIEEVARERGFSTIVWSISHGFEKARLTKDGLSYDSTGEETDPIQALRKIADEKNRTVFILRDFHAFMDDPTVKRWLRHLANQLHHEFKTIIILSPTFNLPEELSKDIAVLDWPLPDRVTLSELLTAVLDTLPDKGKKVQLPREKIVEATLGLTATEAENVFSKTLVAHGTLLVSEILNEKKQIIRKSGHLEFYEPTTTLEDVGGLEELKNWVTKRRSAFTEEARKYGIPTPRGLLLVGVPGCGKSLTAKTIGKIWEMPLLRFDVGSIFQSLVGGSESAMRSVLKTAESVAPAVLWVDEAEKAFSGTGSSNMSDGGTTARVFGHFLTWLQEKTAPVFVVMTSNDVTALPAEFLRKGRFDEIFAVDLPSWSERAEIFRVHIKLRGRNPKIFDLDTLIDASENFSGAEIEQAVISALTNAFYEKREVISDDILHAIQETTPLSTTMQEKIGFLRAWVKGRARLASKAEEVSGGGGRVIEVP